MREVCEPIVRDFFNNKIGKITNFIEFMISWWLIGYFLFVLVDGSADIAFEKYLSNYYSNRKRTDNVVSNDIPLLFPSQFRRSRRGIADECCKKACSITELSQYCRPT